MRTFILCCVIVLSAASLHAGLGPEVPVATAEAPWSIQSFDVTYSGNGYVVVWRESDQMSGAHAIYLRRIARGGTPAPVRVKVASPQAPGTVAVAAAGPTALVAWTECSSGRCRVNLAWVTNEGAVEPVMFSQLFSGGSVALATDGNQFVVAVTLDGVEPGSSFVSAARLRPYERVVPLAPVPLDHRVGSLHVASVRGRELLAWTRLDPRDCGVIILGPPCTVASPWMMVGGFGGGLEQRIPGSASDRNVIDATAGDSDFFVSTMLSAGPSTITRVGENGPVSTREIVAATPYLAADRQYVVALWTSERIPTPYDLHLVISRLPAADAARPQPVIALGGEFVREAAANLYGMQLAAGDGTAMALYRTYEPPAVSRTHLSFRISDFATAETIPARPVNLRLALSPPAATQAATVTWDAAPDGPRPVRFHVTAVMPEYGGPGTDYRSTFGGEVDAAVRVGVLTGLTQDTPYVAQVQAENELGISDPAFVEFRTPAFGPPRAARDLTITPRDDGTALFTWRDMSTAEDGYRVNVWDASTKSYRVLTEVGPNTTSVTLTLLGGLRYYSVIPFNAWGEGPPAGGQAKPIAARRRSAGR